MLRSSSFMSIQELTFRNTSKTFFLQNFNSFVFMLQQDVTCYQFCFDIFRFAVRRKKAEKNLQLSRSITIQQDVTCYQFCFGIFQFAVRRKKAKKNFTTLTFTHYPTGCSMLLFFFFFLCLPKKRRREKKN